MSPRNFRAPGTQRGFGPPHGRPDWWPEDEPWPPTRPPWQVNRRAFLWRVGIIIIVLFFVIGGVTRLGIHFSGQVFDGDGDRPPNWVIGPILFWSVIITGIVMITRRIGRRMEPLFNLIEATQSVAAGDYSVRVPVNQSRQLHPTLNAFNEMTERLQQNDQQRRRMLADIAHELRTPLAVIQGNVEGMLDDVYPRENEQLELLLHESHLISRLLDDLQTLSQAESGALALYPEATDLRQVLEDVVNGWEPHAGAREITLTFDAGVVRPILELDPIRIRQVVENLLSNAVRHTPTGGSIAVELSETPESVIVRIRDSGSGIPPDILPHVFERFVKSADSGGSGLGLAIAKRLVEGHNGTLTAESQEGSGTTMTITLPTA